MIKELIASKVVSFYEIYLFIFYVHFIEKLFFSNINCYHLHNNLYCIEVPFNKVINKDLPAKPTRRAPRNDAVLFSSRCG